MTKLIVAGAVLLVALAFYFLGEGLVGVWEAPVDDEAMPTPTGLLRMGFVRG